MRICDTQQLPSQDDLYSDDMRLLGQDMIAPFPYQRRYSTAIATMGYENVAESGKKKPRPNGRGIFAPPTGFEPVTPRLTVECSAVELWGKATNEYYIRAFSRMSNRGKS